LNTEFYFLILEDLILRNLLRKQIKYLKIDIQKLNKYLSETVSQTFALILSLCENLIDLNFGDVFLTRKCLIPLYCSALSFGIFMSSTLVKLKINVIDFSDVLHLLDGRFQALTILIITVSDICDDITFDGPRVSRISIFMSNNWINPGASILCRIL
jgi:hypothetical protein